jgi:tricorn protease
MTRHRRRAAPQLAARPAIGQLVGPVTALHDGSVAGEPAYWKRYRGGRAGRLWVSSGEDPLFSRVLADLGGQLIGPMLVGGRPFFVSRS